jgi:hypothetical protein
MFCWTPTFTAAGSHSERRAMVAVHLNSRARPDVHRGALGVIPRSFDRVRRCSLRVGCLKAAVGDGPLRVKFRLWTAAMVADRIYVRPGGET